MKCPHCQVENPENAKFCRGCGQFFQIEIVCGHCSCHNIPDSKFCIRCGKPLAYTPTQTLSSPSTTSPVQAQPTSFANGRYQVKKFLGEGGNFPPINSSGYSPAVNKLPLGCTVVRGKGFHRLSGHAYITLQRIGAVIFKRLGIFRGPVATLIMSTIAVVLYCTVVHADSNISMIITSSEVIKLVSETYIPESATAFEGEKESEAALLWREAKAGQPIMQWTISENEGNIVPLNWVCPIEYGERIIGLIGVDPFNGDWAWRIDKLPAEYQLTSPPSQDSLQKASVATMSSFDIRTYDSSQAKLTFIAQ